MSSSAPQPSSPSREKTHTRTIVIDGYRRSDGLWDIEGEIKDVKTEDHAMVTYVHPGDTPIHHMKLRITVDQTLTIRDAQALSLAAPYNPACQAVTPLYERLKGLQIKAGFRAQVAQIVGGAKGCTHLTELVGSLATVAVQTTAGKLPVDGEQAPRQVGGCYAYRESGELVRVHFPRWYRSHAL